MKYPVPSVNKSSSYLNEWVEASSIAHKKPYSYGSLSLLRTSLRAFYSTSAVWIIDTNRGSHVKKWSFFLLCFLRRSSGGKNVHNCDNNWTSEAAQKGEWLWMGEHERRKSHFAILSQYRGTFSDATFFSFPIKAFANPEDALRHGGLQYHREDPYVERCRR